MNHDVTRGGRVRIHEGADGRHIAADVTPASFAGFFSIGLSGLKAIIGAGAVDGRVPTIDGVKIDGTDENGGTVAVPNLDLREGPNDDLRSWICARVVVDLGSGKVDPTNDDALTIVHINDLTGLFSNGFSIDDGSGAGIKPLAMLVWLDHGTVQRAIRDVYFNQGHSFKPAADKKSKGAHFFFPVK